MRPLLLLVLLLSVSAVAAPREFPFTWTSKTSAAGQSSFEGWFTPRFVRTADYFRLDTRVAWVHGVTRTVESQLSLDLDFERTDLTQNLDPRFTSLWRWTTWREGTPFAVAGLGRVSLGLDQLEVEARLIADLHLGRVVLALNASGSRSVFWAGRQGIDTRLEENLGVRYAVSTGVSAGLEVRARSAWREREYQGTAIFMGPALMFTHSKFWVTIGGYAQVASEKAKADRDLPEPAELRDNERFMLRLVIGADTSR